MTPHYPISDAEYGRFRDLIHQRSGLYFPEHKRQDLEMSLREVMAQTTIRFPSVAAYHDFLHDAAHPDAPAELQRLINYLTIGESHFFRDTPQMDALADEVLPRLIAAKRRTAAAHNIPPGLRIWSAGCATGEEPYSLAILLRELIPDIEQWQITLLATDINEDVLTAAQHGLYTEWSFREPRALRLRPLYFSGEGKKYRLRVDIRQMVTFQQHNLIAHDFPAVDNNTTAMDLVICRNVTIYFAPETTRRLLRQFHATLVNGGWLVTGHSEPVASMYAALQTEQFPGAILYRKGTSRKESAATRPRPTPRRKRPFVPVLPLVPALDTGLLRPLPEPTALEKAHDLLAAGQPDEAIFALVSDMDNLPLPEQAAASRLLARTYAGQGQWGEARHWCEMALSLDGLSPDVYLVLALVQEHEDEWEEAVGTLKKVIYLDAQQPLAHFNLALLYRKLAQPAAAYRSLRNASKTLSRYAPETVLPYAGETTAYRLQTAVQRLLNEWEGEV